MGIHQQFQAKVKRGIFYHLGENLLFIIMEEEHFKRTTAPFDARFPNTNQAKHCWQNYADFHRCRRLKGEDYEPCRYFQRVYMSMCKNEDLEKWDDLFEKGASPSLR